MAHKKGAGSSKNGRESHSKRLGIKVFGGQVAVAGNVLVRQRGTKHHPDKNVGIGKDHTLFALIDGTVVFKKKADNKSYVSVLPIANAVVEDAPVKKAAPAKKAEVKGDDLTIIEGIGPKIAEILANKGIATFAVLATKSADEVKELLVAEGNKFNTVVTDTWAEQAQLAADGKFEELEKLKDELDGGKRK